MLLANSPAPVVRMQSIASTFLNAFFGFGKFFPKKVGYLEYRHQVPVLFLHVFAHQPFLPLFSNELWRAIIDPKLPMDVVPNFVEKDAPNPDISQWRKTHQGLWPLFTNSINEQLDARSPLGRGPEVTAQNKFALTKPTPTTQFFPPHQPSLVPKYNCLKTK